MSSPNNLLNNNLANNNSGNGRGTPAGRGTSSGRSGFFSRFNFPTSIDKNYIITLGIVIGFILLVFAIIVIIIKQGNKKLNQQETEDKIQAKVLDYIHDLHQNPYYFPSHKIPISSFGNEYSLSFWVYLNNLDNLNNRKDILSKGILSKMGEIDNDKNNDIEIFIPPHSSDLHIEFHLNEKKDDQEGCYPVFHLAPGATLSPSPDDGSSMKLSGGTDFTDEGSQNDRCEEIGRNLGHQYFGIHNQKCYTFENQDSFTVDKSQAPSCSGHIDIKKVSQSSLVIPNFPTRRWNLVTLNVNQNICHLFMDGELLETKVLSGKPSISEGQDIVLGNKKNTNAAMSNVLWANRNLSVEEIQDYYQKGPRMRLKIKEELLQLYRGKPKAVIDNEEK